jgi:hypothetical protein
VIYPRTLPFYRVEKVNYLTLPRPMLIEGSLHLADQVITNNNGKEIRLVY